MVDEKTEYKMTVDKELRSYELTCEIDSPLGELFDAICEFQLLVIKKMQEVQPKKDATEEAP